MSNLPIESGTFITKYLNTTNLINISLTDNKHWIERIYIDKKTNTPIGIIVYPSGFMHYFIYFDEESCKKLYSDFNSNFHSYGINWFIYNGISEEDTEFGQNMIQKALTDSISIFNYIKLNFDKNITKY
jgi:hypothetical protein